ncbi:hypothetical protein FUA23_10305 [Neolewinella aurantiaca]|uniref:Uncharacterized protein n=1 Tax=Neolewinella aurantiaca TaxID=2602767 RepID=A0A5C7FFH8_9BACT|nr:DUF5691 domain-containing protein [Neolewinella aurantiaca]TXF89583.1 hypothetical protein FUA23_10305 [Neolewinella aurantiaca]
MPTPLRQPDLLSNLTLGTARQVPGPVVAEWLEAKAAVDPTADSAEQLLAAYAISERLHRLSPGTKGSIPSNTAPQEEREATTARLSRALELILRGTYPHVLPEAITVLNERKLLMPPHLLPELLDEAVSKIPSAPAYAEQLLAAGGNRANWLAGQNPEWKELSPGYNLTEALAKEATPGRRVVLLQRLRAKDPAAAREALATIWSKQSPKNQESLLAPLETNIGSEDVPWLRERLGPKRKGVRRAILRLLLLAGDPVALDDMLRLAGEAFDGDGKIVSILRGAEGIELLEAYGGLKKQETVGAFFLSNLPPHVLPELTDRTLPEFWNTLNKDQLKAAAIAVQSFPAPGVRAEFVRYALRGNPAQLPVKEAAAITAALDQETFLEIFHELLTTEKNVFHYGGLARILALSRNEPWSERISKAFVLQLVSTLREVSTLPWKLQNDLKSHWELSLPLLDSAIFGWARTHLHSMTERGDVFGKLATDALQTLAFRRVLRE